MDMIRGCSLAKKIMESTVPYQQMGGRPKKTWKEVLNYTLYYYFYTTDQIFSIPQILEKFCAFKQAYKSVNRLKMWNAMVDLCSPKTLGAVKQICVNNSFVEISSEIEESFQKSR